MRSVWLSLGVVVLVVASCGGGGRGGATSDDGGTTGDGGSSAFGLELLAGDIGGRGNVDGTGAGARLSGPEGVAVDSAGNLYVGDVLNHLLRKVTPAGVVTTLAGTTGVTGWADGTGAAALFNDLNNLAVDSAGNVYVADTLSYIIRKVTPAGVVTTLAGTANVAGSADGTGAAALFSGPSGLAVDSDGNLYVSDFNNETIRRVTPTGVVTTLAGAVGLGGSADGTGAAARFYGPGGLAIDSAGNLYVADVLNYTIRKVTPAGVVTTLAGYPTVPGSADGTGFGARFSLPTSLAIDSTGNLYVTDSRSDTIRKVTPLGVVTTLTGSAGMPGSTDGTEATARFNYPSGLAVDTTGNLYVADNANDTIRKITAAGVVTTLVGAPDMPGSRDGTGPAARFNVPVGLAIDGAGNAYVADAGNATIRKVSATGVVTTLAGTAGMTGSADGTGADARFDEPRGVTVDSVGNVYVADADHTIRKITPAGVVTTLAGTADMPGSTDGTGAAARFNFPERVAVDSAGNVYVADAGNATIRKVSATGVVTTLAGTAGMTGSADGTGAAARFNEPAGVAVDSAGNIYVADSNNATIRKVTPTGTTTTVAGVAGMSGIILGAAPRLAVPQDLVIVGDSIVIADGYAILLLRHGAQ